MRSIYIPHYRGLFVCLSLEAKCYSEERKNIDPSNKKNRKKIFVKVTDASITFFHCVLSPYWVIMSVSWKKPRRTEDQDFMRQKKYFLWEKSEFCCLFLTFIFIASID
jgi:hypothetical protein